MRVARVVLYLCIAACAAPRPGESVDPIDDRPPIIPPVIAPTSPLPTGNVPRINPAVDAPLPFAIAMTRDPDRARLLDDFDSHTFVDTLESWAQRSQLGYSDKHKTEGASAAAVYVPMSSDPKALSANVSAFVTHLPEPEDWRQHAFLTLDAYMEEAPTSLPELNLVLRNSVGDAFATSLILGWRLFQWDNYQMTFPLDGNDYNHPPVPPHILGDIVSVGLHVGRQGDGWYGPPLPGVHYHLDNVRLSGNDMWERFDGPALGWHATGDRGTRAGVGHNHPHGGSGGSLVVRWQATGSGNFAGASTALLTTPIDLSGMHMLRAWASATATAPTRVRMWDGQHTYTSPTVRAVQAEGWTEVSWPLPATGFDLSHVLQLSFEVTDLHRQPMGALYLDDLTAVGKHPVDAVGVRAGPLENYLRWSGSDQVVVRSSRTSYPEKPEDGDIVCAAPRTSCVDGGLEPGATYYYSLFVNGASGPLHAQASQDWLVYSGDTFEAGFSPRNGALGYVRDKTSGQVVSYGGTLWQVVFFDESVLLTLDSDSFGLHNPERRFSWTQNQLRYDFEKDGRALSLYVDVVERPDGLSLRAHIDNHTGLAVRSVHLPAEVSFRSAEVQQALLPIQEGAVLLKHFFTSGRSTHLTRPPLFADALGVESNDGKIGIYAVQDSYHHAALIAGHDPLEPVFQPNNLSYVGGSALSTMGVEQITAIADGTQWSSIDMRLVVGHDLRTIAADYRRDNGFEAIATLRQKLQPFGIYDRLAKNPIYTVEVSKLVEWLKAPVGGAWDKLRTAWLPVLPHGTVFHFTHWQQGIVEDEHPDTQPIWWSQYGPSGALLDLIDAMHADGSLLFPFTNWTVWNKAEHLAEPLSHMDMASRTLRGTDFPFIEYNGFMVKPWHSAVRATNEAMVDLYTTTYPMDALFVDMTGERTWRYVLADDGVTATTIYTQAVAEENRRLAERMPLFTEGVFDRIADSITGYCQTLRQKRWNGVLDHLGTEYLDWVPYPFAAFVVHENVAFYPHDLNSEVWPAVSRALFSYHLLMGYNMYVDTVKHFGEDHYWIEVADAVAKAVNARVFGHPLLDYRLLNAQRTHVESVWGGADPMHVRAYYDPEGSGAASEDGPHQIAPDGFFATSESGDVVAGVFEGTFNGHALSAGTHWITVVRDGSRLEVRQPLGSDGILHVQKPADWDSTGTVQLSVILQDGSERQRGSLPATGETIALPYTALDAATSAYVRGYQLSR